MTTTSDNTTTFGQGSESTRNGKRRSRSTSDTGDSSETGSLASRFAEKIDPQYIASNVRRLPQIVQREMRDNPYRAVGVAVGVGFGVGALFGSKLTRMLLVTAAGYAINEAVRARLKPILDEVG